MCTLIKIQSKKSKAEVYAIPVNPKLPWGTIDKIPDEFNAKECYFTAQFKEWTKFQKKPVLTITSCIGEAGNLEAESMRLLKTHEICTEAYSEDLECLRPLMQNMNGEEWVIPKEELASRLDLRGTRIFTIDPITARDLDDALSVTKVSDNVYEIGVHIADVSYFVAEGTLLDEEAQKRCTSTYFVHKVFPMLPPLLCEKLCSLNPNVDRLAYSILFKMDSITGE
jgi:exoribonuclease R